VVLAVLDLFRAAWVDANSMLDVPLAFIALYIHRLFVIVSLLGSVVDTPLFLLSPLLSTRTRYIVWIGLFTLESKTYEILQGGFIGKPPAWIREQAKWKGAVARNWWNDGNAEAAK
jgi:hypothetical protein